MSTITNEKLAVAAQAGDREALLQLWSQVKSFAAWLARKHYGSYSEDFQQSAFLALMSCVQTFDQQKGDFLTTFKFSLYSAFRTALWGGNSKKHRMDPANEAISIGQHVGPDSDTPLSDFIEDPRDLFESTETQERDKAIRNALEELSEDERRVVALRFFRCLTQAQAAQRMNLTEKQLKSIEAAAFRKLRHPSVSKKLCEYL